MLNKRISIKWQRSLVFGVIYGLFVLVLALWLGKDSITGSIGDQGRYYAPFGAFIAGTLCWWFLLARRGRYSFKWGAIAGFAASVLQYYFGSYAMILHANICFWLFGCGPDGLPPTDPLTGLLIAGGFILLGNLALGIICIPAGIVLGACTGVFQNKGLSDVI